MAIKLLRDEDVATITLSRFREEIQLLGLVRDRAIVRIEQPIRFGDKWGLVMDLVTGASLQRLTSLGAMPPSVATEIVQEVARVIEKVWRFPGPDGQRLRILHRDIKPSNLQLNAGGEIRVLDFGIAKADYRTRDSQVTLYGTGTRGFIAPERLDGTDTLAGDVFSLGVTAHTLIGGERPYKPKRDDPPETVQVDQAMIALFTRMRSPKPSDRPSASEVEDQCGRLRQRSDGMTLREWAERNVPRAIALKFSDEIVGTVLTETAPQRGAVEARPPRARGNTGAHSLADFQPSRETKPPRPPVDTRQSRPSESRQTTPDPRRASTPEPRPSRVPPPPDPRRSDPTPSSRSTRPPPDPRAGKTEPRPPGPASLRPMNLPDVLGRRPSRDDDEDTVIAPSKSYLHSLEDDLEFVEIEELEEIQEIEPDPEPMPLPSRKAPPGQTTIVTPPPTPLPPAPARGVRSISPTPDPSPRQLRSLPPPAPTPPTRASRSLPPPDPAPLTPPRPLPAPAAAPPSRAARSIAPAPVPPPAAPRRAGSPGPSRRRRSRGPRRGACRSRAPRRVRAGAGGW